MFGIGGNEFLIIIVVALLLLGPDKIPEAIKTLRKAMSMYNDAKSQVGDVINTQILTPEDQEFFRDPLGVKGLQTSASNLLTPERKALLTGNTGGSASTPAVEQAVEVQASSGTSTLAVDLVLNAGTSGSANSANTPTAPAITTAPAPTNTAPALDAGPIPEKPATHAESIWSTLSVDPPSTPPSPDESDH